MDIEKPGGFALPSAADLAARLKGLIAACKPQFADPAVTVLTWTNPKG